jgi:hypothetical protein
VPTFALHGINGDSAGNYCLIDEESTQGREFHRELSAHLPRFRPVRSKCTENPSNGYTDNANLFYKFKYEDLFKIKNKPDPVLLGTSYLSNGIKKGYQNLVRLSL